MYYHMLFVYEPMCSPTIRFLTIYYFKTNAASSFTVYFTLVIIDEPSYS